jgi:hypothetical protein
MKPLSKSPERNTFQKKSYIARQTKIEKPVDQDLIDIYNQMNANQDHLESNSGWSYNNLEYDLRSTDWILEKVRSSEIYAQNLYAALCNNDFQKLEVMPVLKEETWCCSWRSAGGVVANMRQQGDYIDWYCSGIRNDSYQDDLDIPYPPGTVGEGHVTEEIQSDLKKLGWIVLNSND